MPRLASLSAIVLLCSIVSAPAAYRPSSPNTLKGFRAVLLQGEPIDGAVRIGNVDVATELYGKVVTGWRTGTPVGADYKSAGRPCIGMHFIRLNDRTTYLPTDALHAGDAGFTYWFYQAVGDEPAVFMTGRSMSQELSDELASWGVPVKMTKPAKGACEFEKAR